MENIKFEGFTTEFLEKIEWVKREQTKQEKREGYALRMKRKQEKREGLVQRTGRRGDTKRRAQYTDLRDKITA